MDLPLSCGYFQHQNSVTSRKQGHRQEVWPGEGAFSFKPKVKK